METVGRLTTRLLQEGKKKPAPLEFWIWDEVNCSLVIERGGPSDDHSTVFPHMPCTGEDWRGRYDPEAGEVLVYPPWEFGADAHDVVVALMNEFGVGLKDIISNEPNRWMPESRKVETFTTQKARFVQQGAGDGDVDWTFSQFRDLAKKGALKGSAKDIDTYKNLNDVKDAVAGAENPPPSKTTLRKASKGGAVKVYDDSKKSVYRIDTFEASQYYGSGTKWCISGWGGVSDGHWDELVTSDGNTYYFVISKTKPKSDPLYKIAVEVPPEGHGYTLWDAMDEPMEFWGFDGDTLGNERDNPLIDLGFSLSQIKKVFGSHTPVEKPSVTALALPPDRMM